MLTPNEQRLVAYALPVVDTLARRHARRFPGVPEADFHSVGSEALVLAARSFDPTRGVPFESFAYLKVRGAMVRVATGEAFGSLHILLRKKLAAADPDWQPPEELTLEQALVDTPEKAKARAVAWVQRQAAGMFVTALRTMADAEVDTERETMRAEERARAREGLSRALADLDDNERYFVDRHYTDGATFEQIAQELGVVKRTITRLHDKVKDKLLRSLKTKGIDALPPSER